MPALPEVHIIVLAGDRGPDDPVARHCGVSGKAMAPVAGRVMLTRVLDALAQAPLAGRVIVVCPEHENYGHAIAASRLASERVIRVPPGGSPSASAAAGLGLLPPGSEVLLVTADHPLLQAGWIVELLDRARALDAGLATALVPIEVVQQAYPRNRRTRLAFSDGAMCGTNLFLFRTSAARGVTSLWQQIELQRKRPWRIVAWLGPLNLLRYLAGRMSRDRAFALLSARAGVAIRAVVLDDPAAAVDVDTVDDLVLVERIIASRVADAAD
jgi:CTP:molybdopterin cytidylyltransferase MocA